MAIKITEDCINCDACLPECPNNAIYEPGASWRYADGTALQGNIATPDGRQVQAEAGHAPLSKDFYFIIPDKCTECVGFHEEPQCASVCPVDCCVPDERHVEPEEALYAKKEWLHG